MSCAHSHTTLKEFHSNSRDAYALCCDECSGYFYDHASVKRRFDEKDKALLDLLSIPGVESIVTKRNPEKLSGALKAISYWNLRENYIGKEMPGDW